MEFKLKNSPFYRQMSVVFAVSQGYIFSVTGLQQVAVRQEHLCQKKFTSVQGREKATSTECNNYVMKLKEGLAFCNLACKLCLPEWQFKAVLDRHSSGKFQHFSSLVCLTESWSLEEKKKKKEGG